MKIFIFVASFIAILTMSASANAGNASCVSDNPADYQNAQGSYGVFIYDLNQRYQIYPAVSDLKRKMMNEMITNSKASTYCFEIKAVRGATNVLANYLQRCVDQNSTVSYKKATDSLQIRVQDQDQSLSRCQW